MVWKRVGQFVGAVGATLALIVGIGLMRVPSGYWLRAGQAPGAEVSSGAALLPPPVQRSVR